MQVFVDDWLCYDAIIGEGAFGEVKLLINQKTNEKVACKIINYDKHSNASGQIERETTIHRRLNHENIIQFLGRRREEQKEYIFMEFAPGGELFQLIEPDVGMPASEAQSYMKQLLCGVKYLHSIGITHRDIKPENLLIGTNGVLKISDFGLATMFRARGVERLLTKRCGTKPYLAPEVLTKEYRAQPADLWSCGIVLVAMLTGELPWGDTSPENEEFRKWSKDIYISDTPWSKLGNTALSLARQILNILPAKRLKMEQIEKHPWMRFSSCTVSSVDAVDGIEERSAKRFNSMVETESRLTREKPDVVQSQPLPSTRPAITNLINDQPPRRDLFFSQPTQNENLVIQFTQSPITKDNFNTLVKRMTRFYVSATKERTLEVLSEALECSHCSFHIDSAGVVTISTIDAMKNQLSFKAMLYEMEGRHLLDFRLAKGCGLAFKKKFLKLRTYFSDIIDKAG